MITFLTGNQMKYEEAKLLIPDLQRLQMDLPEVQSLDSQEIIRAKLEAAREHHGGALIVDDISFELSCLNGLPGPLIKWWLERMGAEGLWRVATALGDTRARAVCTIGYAHDGGVEFFSASADGKVVEPRKGRGFGWDAVFVPDGETRTYGEMPIEEKNSMSPRGRCVRELARRLDPER